MWVLLLIFIGKDGAVIAYDQGQFLKWSECRDTGVAMVQELDNNYISTCVEIPTKGK